MQIHKEFFRYVMPSMLAFALSGVYAIADGFFVGNELGDSALAAVNMAYPMTAFLQAAGTGIGMGGAIRYAISMGNRDKDQARRYFGMALLLLIAAGVCLTAVFLAGAPAVLALFGAEGDIFALGREYLLYIGFGAVFQVMGTGLVPFIRNMGSAVAAMAAMIAGFLTNIFLDYLLVWRLPWGMAGAAAATVIGQAVTFAVCLAFFFRRREKPLFRFEKKAGGLAGEILSVGLSPFGLTYSPNLTLILVNKSAALVGGTLAVTCYAPVSYISAIVMLLLQGVSDGSQPLISLAFGEGRLEKTKKVRNMAYGFALLVAFLCTGLLLAVRGEAALLFGASGKVTALVAFILPIFCTGFLFAAFSRVTTAYFYAAGRNVQAYLLIYGEPLFLFLLLLFLPNLLGVQGTWAAVPISQILAAAVGAVLAAAERKRGMGS